MIEADVISQYRERGRIYTDHLERHCNYVKKILRQDWDWWSYGVGDEGTGKSTGSIYYAKKVGGDLFKLDEHICYDPLGFLKLVDTCPKYGVILVDEAGEAMFNRDFASKFNKAIVKTSQQCRDRNLLIIFNLPSIDLLDSKLIRRCKTYTIYEAPKFKRGKSLWHMPQRRRYDPKQFPWFELQFVYWFQDLPKDIREEYKIIKSKEGEARVAKYIEQLEKMEEKETDKGRTAAEYCQDIKRMPKADREKLISNEHYSTARIRAHMSVPDRMAQDIALLLNDKKED
jgi:hypothetical protein